MAEGSGGIFNCFIQKSNVMFMYKREHSVCSTGKGLKSGEVEGWTSSWREQGLNYSSRQWE